MKKIVLLCAAGLSTSALVSKMRKYSSEKGYDYDINAYSVSEVVTVAHDADCVLIGPQVRFHLNKVKEQLPNIPCEVIDMKSYGMMDGKAVVEMAKGMMRE